MPSKDAAVEQLYGLAPEEFVAARTELAKQVRADGDADAARDIAGLGKPTLAAWFANQLVRQQPDDVAALIELGETLRSATAKLDAARIRELSAEQRRLVGALLKTARKLGEDAGRSVTDAVSRALEDTLHAALADPDAADRLRGGALTAPLTSSGFPGVELAAQPAPKPAAKAAKPAGNRPAKAAAKAPEKSAANAALRDARAALRDAESARTKAQRAVTAAEQQVQRAADGVDRLESALADARRARIEADKAHRKAVRAAADADRAVRTAKAGVDKAR